ncbi:MAG: T9SS type A sorting domain-containing protein [Flavobacteriales bacterium]|nr:T9SS type A sorting domain-containing protein [Flavobacteriales bacterium]
MKNIYLLTATLLFSNALLAQNLVVNPSFEQTASNCGNFGGEGFFTDLAATWNSANSNSAGDSCSSPDLFAPCNVVFGIGVTAMPDNELGWQYARTGERYVGIITHEPLSNYREYIQGRTSAPLQAGQQYCVSFFVSRADNVPYATNNMGVYFSNTEYWRDACPSNSLINVTPQLNYTCAPITDTLNWVRLEWSYTATGGEQYFTIGNFFNNANTTIVNVGGGGLNPYAYYYIDDVRITAGGECCYTQIAAVGTKCLSDAPFALVAQPPIGSDCTPTVTGTWSGPGVNANTGVFTPSVAGVGTHTISFTLSCGYVATTTITVNACAELNICLEENGNLTVSGGSGSYTWASSSTEQDCSGCTFGICTPFCPGVTTTVWTTFSTSATATPPGTWPIRVTDGQGGIVTLTSTNGITACATGGCDITITPTSVVNACGGASGSATVSVTGASGNANYSWNTNPLQNGTSATGLTAGEYTITVSDGAVCTETLTIAIQDGELFADAGENHVICKGESTTLTASGGTGYQWDNGLGSGATVSAAPAQTTTYTVTVTSGNCTAYASVTVTVADPPIAEIQSAITSFCDNAASTEMSATPAGGVFSGPGMTGSSFSPAAAGPGVHFIVYTYYDFEECPSVATLEVTVDICTGLENSGQLRDVTVHPNPTDGLLMVGGLNGLSEHFTVSVLDPVGRVVAAPLSRNGDVLMLDVNDLSAGLYVLRLADADGHARSFRIIRN